MHFSNPGHKVRRQLPGVQGHRLGAVICLVYAHQSVSQFKHVVSQGDDDELCIFCALLKIKGKQQAIGDKSIMPILTIGAFLYNKTFVTKSVYVCVKQEHTQHIDQHTHKQKLVHTSNISAIRKYDNHLLYSAEVKEYRCWLALSCAGKLNVRTSLPAFIVTSSLLNSLLQRLQ